MFEHSVPIRWADIDSFGHVNHAVFLTYLEIGRDAFYASVIPEDPLYVIVRAELDYRAEILLRHEHVMVQVVLEKIGTTSVTTRERIVLPDGVVAAEALAVTVRWDFEVRQSRAITPSERERLLQVLEERS